MVLGVGGFGTVYKGWVEEKTMLPSKHGTGMMVAIKKLNHESVQGFQEWQVCNLYCNLLTFGNKICSFFPICSEIYFRKG